MSRFILSGWLLSICCFSQYALLGQANALQQSYIRDYEARNYALGYVKAQELLTLTTPKTVESASILHDLGRFARLLKSDSAALFYTKALGLKEQLLGKNSDSYINTLRELANYYRAEGKKPAESENLVLQMTQCADNSGSLWARYFSIENIATIHLTRGNYTTAALKFEALLQIDDSLTLTNSILPSCYTRELPIRKNLDNETRKANNQNAVAACYAYLYAFEKAIHYAEPAIDIFRKINSPNLFAALNTLAGSYDNLGQSEKALKTYLEAFSLLKKQSKIDSVHLTSLANNIGYCYERQDLIHKSIPYYQLSLEARRKLPPSARTDDLISKGCYKLGYAYLINKQEDSSLLLLRESLNLKNKTKEAQEHPDYGIALEFLGGYFYLQKQLDSALFYHEKFYQHGKSRLAQNHEQNLQALLSTGIINAKKQAFSTANDRLNLYNTIQLDNIQHTFSYLSEHERALYLNKFTKDFNELQSLCLEAQNNDLSTVLLQNALIYKGLLLEESLSWQQDIAKNRDKNIVEAYKNLKKQQAKLDLAPPSERSNLEKDIRLLESQLNKSRSSSSENNKLTDWRTIQKTLNEGEACIEFVHFKVTNFSRPTDSIFYVAYIIRKDMDTPQYVLLFEEKKVEALLRSNPSQKDIAMLYKGEYRGTTGIEPLNKAQTTGVAADLFKLIWSPIEPYLKDIKKIWYAPSGLLNRVSFEAIPLIPLSIKNGLLENLSDKYDFNHISSSKILLAKHQQNTPITLTDAVIFGDINYDSVGVIKIRKPAHNYLLVSIGSRYFSQRAGGEISWQSLKGTRQEIQNVYKILQQQRISTTIYDGQRASEESFKAFSDGLPSPSIIHIATHGYFFPKEDKQQQDSTDNQFTASDNPLIRSGLILAGANRTWRGNTPINQEDGILTANEIRRLNLNKTKLAVLSACETGLGDIHGSEGVFGLQRAFKQAGVRYLLVSLWKIPDVQTANLMQLFYEKLVTEKDIRKAFREAQKIIRKRYPNQPFYWAGFVLIE